MDRPGNSHYEWLHTNKPTDILLSSNMFHSVTPVFILQPTAECLQSSLLSVCSRVCVFVLVQWGNTVSGRFYLLNKFANYCWGVLLIIICISCVRLLFGEFAF